MSDKEKQELQDKIIKDLESDIKNIENTLEVMKEKLQYLKDIAWDRQSKRESSQMFNVLEGRKEKTEVKSNAGSIVVGSDLMQKVRNKHLDDPALRGMITTQETLSFPKVAKNVEPEYNEEINDYTWKAKANDESILAYGSRKYEQDDKEINRLLTTHSKTERGQRQADRVSSATYFNDPDCRGSAHSEIIAQNKPNSANSLHKEQNIQKEFNTKQIKAMQEQTKKASQNLGLGDNAKGKRIELGKYIDLGKKR